MAAISRGQRARRLQHALGVGGDVVDQADLLGPLGADVLAGEGQLGQVAGADDGGQPLQAAEVGDDGHLGLAHREDGVGGGQADVAGGDEVDAAADAVAVHGGDHRLRALRDRRDGGLEPEYLVAGVPGPGRQEASRRRRRRAGATARQELPMALRSRPTEKCGPWAATTTTRTSWSSPTAAMARGRSRHSSGPMALRASGRSSHTVATPSAALDRQDR